MTYKLSLSLSSQSFILSPSPHSYFASIARIISPDALTSAIFRQEKNCLLLFMTVFESDSGLTGCQQCEANLRAATILPPPHPSLARYAQSRYVLCEACQQRSRAAAGTHSQYAIIHAVPIYDPRPAHVHNPNYPIMDVKTPQLGSAEYNPNYDERHCLVSMFPQHRTVPKVVGPEQTAMPEQPHPNREILLPNPPPHVNRQSHSEQRRDSSRNSVSQSADGTSKAAEEAT
jgi:hypothetical protein